MYIYSHQHNRLLYDIVGYQGKFYKLKPELEDIYIFTGLSKYIDKELVETTDIKNYDIIYTDGSNLNSVIDSISKLSTYHKIIADTGEGVTNHIELPNNICEIWSQVPMCVNAYNKPLPRGYLKGAEKCIELGKQKSALKRDNLVLARWNPNTNYGNRSNIYRWCEQQKYIKTEQTERRLGCH